MGRRARPPRRNPVPASSKRRFDSDRSPLPRPTSDYREFTPRAGLDSWVGCLWSQTIGPSGADFLQRVLPDGCADIVWIGHGGPRVVGPATRTVIERLPPGSNVVGIRFRPGATAAALGISAAELCNAQAELDAVVGRRTALNFVRAAEAPTLAAKLAAVDEAMRLHLANRPAPDPVVVAVVSLLEQRLTPPVRDITAAAGPGLSERQIRRRFRTAVGYGLKTFQRVARLRRLRALASSPARLRHLAMVAYDLGYADQAHMTREITLLAGVSPALLVRHAARIQTASDPFTQ